MRKIAIREVDLETGLEKHLAEKIKQLEQENQQLKQEIINLQNENQLLRDEIKNIGVRSVIDESGGKLEFVLKDKTVLELTSDGVLKPSSPNTLKVGNYDEYLNDVITANITITSSMNDKIDVEEVDEKELEKIIIPKPRKYKRIIGAQREEIGFITEELPEIIRYRNGYDLKALVAILAWKIMRIEEFLKKNPKMNI